MFIPFHSSRNNFFSAGDRRRCGKTGKRMPPPPRGGIRFDSRQVYPINSSPGMIPLPPPGCSRAVRFPGAARGGFIPRVQGKTESPPAARRELKPDYYTKKRGGSRREIRGRSEEHTSELQSR